MLLLPITLATLSISAGAALLPGPGLDEAPRQLPAAAPVADIAVPSGLTELTPRDCSPGHACVLSDQRQGAGPRGQPPEDEPGFGPAASPASLDGMRGGDATSGSAIIMNGTVADNRATNVVTGTNMITEGSFANASGVPMVVQNTGANVLIQNATVINLQLR